MWGSSVSMQALAKQGGSVFLSCLWGHLNDFMSKYRHVLRTRHSHHCWSCNKCLIRWWRCFTGALLEIPTTCKVKHYSILMKRGKTAWQMAEEFKRTKQCLQTETCAAVGYCNTMQHAPHLKTQRRLLWYLIIWKNNLKNHPENETPPICEHQR